MTFKSYAKINLGLNVYRDKITNTHKHKIETIMMLVQNMYDVIEIEENDVNVVEYFKDNEQLELENCLVLRSLNYLTEKGFITKSYKISITKSIPMSSGFGGGSSNAGTVIAKLMKLENQPISNLNFFEIADILGSDIPFFITENKIAFVTGIGDVVEKIETNSNLNFTVYKNSEKINTAQVYDHFLNETTSLEMNDYKDIINRIYNGLNINSTIYNNLTESCLKFVGSLRQKIDFLKTKHQHVFLNGSGTSLIGIDGIKIRSRYAPSPTGYFHIGGARTAIFNYLFAKHNDGDFIVRIEDTDIERNVPGGIESQLNNINWLGITPDESIMNPGNFGPYIQSEKLKKYEELAEQLVKEGKAYYCFCSKEKLDAQRDEALRNHKTPRYQRNCINLTQEEIQANLENNVPYIIRLKINDNKLYSWYDTIRGKISVIGSSLTDPAILKSNKIAMYNFAVVVDDYDMNITHVLRGEEHISNTPYQLAIAEALGKDMSIKYGHLSVIVDETGKKLSKRNEQLKQFIEDYQNIGCMPEALLNFLTLLGWSSVTNKEILSKKEIIEEFSLDAISKAPAFFDEKKLAWISNEYFKKASDEEYLAFVSKFIDVKFKSEFDVAKLNAILLIFKNQIAFATDLNMLIQETFYFTSDSNIIQNKEILDRNIKLIKLFRKLVKKSKQWSIESINEIIAKVKDKTGVSGKELFMPIRISATRLAHGPELVRFLNILGKEKVLNNIDFCLDLVL